MKRFAVLFVVLAAGGCSRTPTPEAGELRVVPLGGDVRIFQDGESSILEEAITVDSGVGLITGTDGRAQVELPGGSSVELAPEAEVRVDGDEPHISSGSALIRAVSGITVRAGLGGDAEITATDSIFRVDSDISVLLAVYEGAATVFGSGVDQIGALQQATVVQGTDIHSSPGPLVVKPNDPWDAELLGEEIDLGLRLDGLQKGLTRQLPSGREIEAVTQTLAEDFPLSSIRAALAELDDAARIVIAAALAQEIERLDGGSRAEILTDVVNLQSLGADWIVIVARWGLATVASQVLAGLGDLAASIAEAFSPSLAEAAASTESPASPNGGDTPGGETGGDPGGETETPDPPGPDERPDPPNKRGGNTPPPAPPPDEQPEENPAQSCGNEVECAVDDVIGDTPGGP
jgi:hypothetical protein